MQALCLIMKLYTHAARARQKHNGSIQSGQPAPRQASKVVTNICVCIVKLGHLRGTPIGNCMFVIPSKAAASAEQVPAQLATAKTCRIRLT